MGMIKEFREFALKGNVLDLAVGVIIGGAFGGIVNSMIKDMIMPVVSIPGNVDFTNKYLGLTDKARDAISAATVKTVDANGQEMVKIPTLEEARAMGPVLAYGSFITVTINFIILAFCIFIVVKLFNSARKRFEAEKPAAAPAGPTPSELLLKEIRDELRARPR